MNSDPTGPAAETDRRPCRWATAFLIATMGLLVALAGRLCYVKTAFEPLLGPLIQRQQRAQIVVPACRGTIFDRHGRILAGSHQLPSLFVDTMLLDQVDVSARQIAGVLGIDAGELEDRFRHSASPRFSWIRRRIDREQGAAVAALNIRAVGTIREGQREYPLGTSLAHVLGFVGADEQGLAGVEGLYDSHLRGRPGSRSAYCTVARRFIGPTDQPGLDAVDGGHLVLTIDSVIQGFAERALARQVEEFEAVSGVSLVMSPKTGEVLAMASLPTFAPAHYQDYPVDARRNLAVTDPVEPGSTFKPFILAAALAHGVVQPDERIDCHDGYWYFGRRRIRDTKPRGVLLLEDIVVKSSNIGMALLGERLGNAALHQAVSDFGFGARTGLGLPGESRGLVRPVSQWTTYSTVSVAFGQEIGVTPIQMANAFCSVVNGGILLQPRIVRVVMSPDGRVSESNDQPRPLRRVLPVDVARFLQQRVLVRVVTDGGGIDAALPDYQVLGKTGTAQVARLEGGGYEPDAYVSSFIGAAPAEDPEVVVLVMIYRPNPAIGYYGRKVAAPGVRAILADTLAYLGVPTRPASRPGYDTPVLAAFAD